MILVFLVSVVFWYIYAQNYFPVYGVAAMLLSFTVLPYAYRVVKHLAGGSKH